MAKKKITGWAINLNTFGVVHLVVIKANDHDDAVKQLSLMGCDIIREDAIKEVCLIPAPGPDIIHDWPEYDFENAPVARERND